MDVNEVMSSWVNMNNALRSATEAESKDMLDHEKSHNNRPAFLLRIFGRYNTLRAVRERTELLTAKKGK